MSDYIKNYLNLAWAIVFEQCREYYETCLSAKKFPDSPYRKALKKSRRDALLNHSYASYLDVNIEAVVQEIEKKVERGEIITWWKY